jgi:hypothetical protein
MVGIGKRLMLRPEKSAEYLHQLLVIPLDPW